MKEEEERAPGTLQKIVNLWKNQGGWKVETKDTGRTRRVDQDQRDGDLDGLELRSKSTSERSTTRVRKRVARASERSGPIGPSGRQRTRAVGGEQG